MNATGSRGRRKRRTALAGVVVALLAGALTGLIVWRSLDVTPAVAESGIEGLWKSRGYGWIWSIEGERFRTWDDSGQTCLAAGGRARSTRSRGLEFRLDPDGGVLRVRDGDPTYDYIFDRISGLPERCDERPGRGPAAILDIVDDIFRTHYPFFDVRKIDWPDLMAQSRALLDDETGDAELFQILTGLLSHIPDDHVTLEGRVDGRDLEYSFGLGRTMSAVAAQAAREDISLRQMTGRWQRRYWDGDVADTLLGGEGVQRANGQIRFGMIAGDIGYINLRSMEDFAEHGERGSAS